RIPYATALPIYKRSWLGNLIQDFHRIFWGSVCLPSHPNPLLTRRVGVGRWAIKKPQKGPFYWDGGEGGIARPIPGARRYVARLGRSRFAPGELVGTGGLTTVGSKPAFTSK